MSKIMENRKFMHCPSFKEGMAESDQAKGVKAPPFGKPVVGRLITLEGFEGTLKEGDYHKLLDTRRSIRKFTGKPMTQAELSFMLWSVQGIQEFRGEVATLRPTPSGGARHPFETYIAVKNAEGLEPALYHYLPAENVGQKECKIQRLGDGISGERISEMLANQTWAAKAPIVLFYSCIPYKAEWRYVDMAHRVMLIDLGHAGQNAMLSATALGLGSCCMAAFDQKACDDTLGFDGVNEYTVYAIAVGTPDFKGL